MTPRQIAELVYAEFTPLSKMTIEESIDHVEQLIKESNKQYRDAHYTVGTYVKCENKTPCKIIVPQ